MVVTHLDEQSKSENYESFAMSNKNENVSQSFVGIFVLSLAENSVPFVCLIKQPKFTMMHQLLCACNQAWLVSKKTIL